jgi:LacI family transcriptional regulator
MVTIEEIAKQAGVSAGTVSRVLNGKNKEDRPAIARRCARIREIAQTLGYRPNVAARSMLRGRFGLVAFVTCGTIGLDWFPHPMLHGIHGALESADTRLTVNEIAAEKFEDEHFVPLLLRESTVDGMIIHLNPAFSDRIVPFFEGDRVPCAWVNAKRPLRCIYPDDFAGGVFATRDLIARGHKKIAFFNRTGLNESWHFSESDRLAGYRHAMEQAGLEPILYDQGKVPRHELFKQVVDRARRALTAFGDATAVLCYEMEEAIPLWVACSERGIKLPADLDILAFHETPIESETAIPVRTVIVPFKQVGIEAANMMNQMIETGQRELPSIAVPYAEIETDRPITLLPDAVLQSAPAGSRAGAPS